MNAVTLRVLSASHPIRPRAFCGRMGALSGCHPQSVNRSINFLCFFLLVFLTAVPARAEKEISHPSQDTGEASSSEDMERISERLKFLSQNLAKLPEPPKVSSAATFPVHELKGKVVVKGTGSGAEGKSQ